MSKAIWIVVANSAHARFYSIAHQPTRLAEIHPDIAGLTRDHKRDLAGGGSGHDLSSTGGKIRHGHESRHDPKKVEKHNFLAALSEVLEHAARSNAFEALVLVAPKRSLGELRQLLSEKVSSLLIAEISKDLTKHSAAELWAPLEPVLGREMVGLPPIAPLGKTSP